MSSNPESDRILDVFARDLATTVGGGWTVVRLISGNADRSFEVRGSGGTVAFTAHLSQSDKGFWGLTPDKADTMLRERREHLVLLRGQSIGYFISNTVLQRLMPKFSVHKTTGAIKINEGIVRAEQRFRDVDDLWALLEARVVPPAT